MMEINEEQTFGTKLQAIEFEVRATHASFVRHTRSTISTNMTRKHAMPLDDEDLTF